MRLRYTEQAQGHISSIFDYIAKDDPQAAARVVARVRASAQAVSVFPYMGHVGHVPGTLEFVVARLPYIIAYRVEIGDQDQVAILGVLHTRPLR